MLLNKNIKYQNNNIVIRMLRRTTCFLYLIDQYFYNIQNFTAKRGLKLHI